MKGGKKMSGKEFFRLTLSKVILTVLFISLYFMLSPSCSPLFVDTFNSQNVGAGIIYPCGKMIEELYNLTNKNPWLGFAWLCLAYILSSLIVYIFNKIKRKK